MKSPIRSDAQLRMLQRAATDADYAKERGVAQEVAQSLLDGHETAGSPKLPDRVDARSSASSAKPRTFKLLGSR